MKAFLLCLLIVQPLAAQVIDTRKENLSEITDEVVNEVVIGDPDDLDKKVKVFYTGPRIQLNERRDISAFAVRSASDVQKVIFFLTVKCPFNEWQSFALSEPQLRVDGKKLDILVLQDGQTLSANGSVGMEKPIQLTLEQALLILAGGQVTLAMGREQWSLTQKQKVPLMAVLGNWVSHGGDASAYKALVRSIDRPSQGLAYTDVVKKYGPPESQDKETGWAVWVHFSVRFKNGKVIETKPRL